MATVSIPREFFEKELRIYSNWREAFARELLQNATDACPSRIDIHCEDHDGFGRVTFTDDGHGMTRAVLEEVFFALGRTTKNDATTIGGFGRARMIICFGQRRYRIRTGNLVVEGEAGEYTITESADHVPGCEFQIDLIDNNVEEVRDAFKNLLRRSSVDVPVFLDGNRFWPANMPSRATRVLRDRDDKPWGRVYANSNGMGQIIVRVHGLLMFRRWISGCDDITVELVPTRSREVLSANRDQLNGEFADQLDQFISDLTRNRRKALRPPVSPLDVQISAGGFFVSDSPLDTPEPVVATEQITSDGPTTTVRVTAGNDAAYDRLQGTLSFSDCELGLSSIPQGLGFDVFLMADANDARVRRLVRSWDPNGWDDSRGRRRRALLLAWKAAVGVALDGLLTQQTKPTSIRWTVGWTFDTDTRALHRKVAEGHVFALNPVDEKGATAWQLSQRASRQRLLAYALHEVAHVAVDGHDEDFAGVLTELIASVDIAAADRAIRDAVANA